MKISRSLRSKAPLIALPVLAFVVVGCGQNEESASKPPPPAGVEKKPAAVGTTPAAPASQQRRMAYGKEIIPLTIRNHRASPVTLRVTKTDNYDWTSPRPDHPPPEGFQGTTMKPWEENTWDLGVNMTADVNFEIEFHLDNKQDPPTVRLQKKAGCCSPKNSFTGWGSSDTDDYTCDAVTKSFPAQKVKVTMECDLPGYNSRVKIEAL